jgi:hypothetical protein
MGFQHYYPMVTITIKTDQKRQGGVHRSGEQRGGNPQGREASLQWLGSHSLSEVLWDLESVVTNLHAHNNRGGIALASGIPGNAYSYWIMISYHSIYIPRGDFYKCSFSFHHLISSRAP